MLPVQTSRKCRTSCFLAASNLQRSRAHVSNYASRPGVIATRALVSRLRAASAPVYSVTAERLHPSGEPVEYAHRWHWLNTRAAVHQYILQRMYGRSRVGGPITTDNGRASPSRGANWPVPTAGPRRSLARSLTRWSVSGMRNYKCLAPPPGKLAGRRRAFRPAIGSTAHSSSGDM